MLCEAIVPGFGKVTDPRDAKRTLTRFREAADVPCLADMPLGDALASFKAWFLRADPRNAEPEAEAPDPGPPAELLRQAAPTVELSRVPARERKSSVVSTQLSRHYYRAAARGDVDIDLKHFLAALADKQRPEEADFLEGAAARARVDQPPSFAPKVPPVMRIKVARPADEEEAELGSPPSKDPLRTGRHVLLRRRRLETGVFSAGAEGSRRLGVDRVGEGRLAQHHDRVDSGGSSHTAVP